MFVKELSGHSGCKLCLHKEGETIFVRKSAATPEYNARLKKQCAKQMSFLSSTVFSPKVLARGITEGRFYFDMDFVQGKTLAESVASMSVLDIEDVIKILFSNMTRHSNKASSEVNIIFREKIEQLRPIGATHSETTEALETVSNFDWQHANESPCHGDLTLENILITPEKKFFVIDLLDSFYNSWMIDIAKLLQDVELGWSFRLQDSDTTRDFRLLVAKESLFAEIRTMDNHPCIEATIYHLLLLNVLRIYPYAKDEHTLRFLNASLQKVMYILNTDVKRQAA